MNFSYPDGKYKALIMSYDDGVVDDIRLISLFDQYGITGTFNLNSGYLGMTRGWPTPDGDTVYQAYVPGDSLNTIYKNHEIAAHGVYHQDFSHLTDDEILKEVETDIKNLERLTHRKIKSMAYPFGNTNLHIAGVVARTQLTNARTINDTHTFALPADVYRWDPTCHDIRVNDYVEQYIALNEHTLSVLYVWGHAWEFKDEKRWENIKTFCKTIGNRDDIWYVGSGEFIDYLKALDNVKMDEDEIINPPGNAAVWVELSNGFKILGPGDKLKIKKKR